MGLTMFGGEAAVRAGVEYNPKVTQIVGDLVRTFVFAQDEAEARRKVLSALQAPAVRVWDADRAGKGTP